MIRSNEELLREGECPVSDCIEIAGHSGPHSFEAMTTDCPNPDAEKAALAEALERLISRCEEHHLALKRYPPVPGEYNCRIADDGAVLLANLSPAAKAILEKAQAHDAMKAENERLRAALHRPRCPNTKAVEIEDGASQTYPSRRGRCSVCGYKGPVNNSGNLWRHSSQAALAGKERE